MIVSVVFLVQAHKFKCQRKFPESQETLNLSYFNLGIMYRPQWYNIIASYYYIIIFVTVQKSKRLLCTGVIIMNIQVSTKLI